METLMAIQWVAVIAVACLLIGFGLAWLIFGGSPASRSKVKELEDTLETAQEEMEDYKREVYGQFSETAEKFRALDKSYHDLHRQLATSSVALLGDQDTPLLLSDDTNNEADLREEIVVDEAVVDEAVVDEVVPDTTIEGLGEVVTEEVTPEEETTQADSASVQDTDASNAERPERIDEAKSAG